MSLYRCKVCGSPKVAKTTQAGGITFNFAKGLIGEAVLGLGGAVAGLESKTEIVYACPDCGAIEKEPMLLEMKLLIDVGVMSTEARNNLVFYGSKLDWDLLKQQYPGIESGFGDQAIEAQKQQYKQILSAKATASREEFNKALETIYMFYKKHGYWDSSQCKTITAKDCAKAYAALDVFIENLSQFYTGEQITNNRHSCFQYKDLSFELGKCLVTYLYLKYYKKYGIPVFEQDENVLRFMYDDPYVQAFLREYERPCKMGGCWNYIQREDRYKTFRLTQGLDYFVQWFYVNLDDQVRISMYYPRYLYDNKEAYELDAKIDKEKARVHIDRYNALLQTKTKYTQKVESCKNELANIAAQRRSLAQTAAATEAELKKYQDSALLSFLGKKKIAALEAEAKRIAGEDKRLAAAEAESNAAVEKWTNLLNDTKVPEMTVLALQIAQEQNYFIEC